MLGPDSAESSNGPRRLAVICARGGSTGVPRKNLWRLHGESLLARAIRQAREAECFETIVVSSDDEEILQAAEDARAPHVVRRPDELASHSAPKIPAIRHAVEACEQSLGSRFEVIVDLDVTTPLRSPEDIRDVVAVLETTDAGIVLTASPSRRSPYFNLVELDRDGVPYLARGEGGLSVRQDSPPTFDLSGAVYAWRREVLFRRDQVIAPETRLHVIPVERAWDIDTPTDLLIVRALDGRRV